MRADMPSYQTLPGQWRVGLRRGSSAIYHRRPPVRNSSLHRADRRMARENGMGKAAGTKSETKGARTNDASGHGINWHGQAKRKRQWAELRIYGLRSGHWRRHDSSHF